MVYKTDFQDLELSGLGFGTMRLPLLPGGKGKDIDQQMFDEMVDLAIENGINYFDTAAPYHESFSELAVGKSLSRYPRESYFLADKYPGHQISSSYDPKATFEEQLKKCGVDYFDFYLMHNVNETSINNYLDPKWKMVDYFIEQKKIGRIRHLGFSTHGSVPCIERFLDAYGEHMEFCQIQLNYLDWTLQDAKRKYDMLTAKGIPIWVMEPVRGGKLAAIDEASTSQLKELRPDETVPAWAFRFLQGLPNVKMILSGMSNVEQMKDNLNTFKKREPLNKEEMTVLLDIAEKLKNSVPCTGCRYCVKTCPAHLEIPEIIRLYNDAKLYPSINIDMRRMPLGEAGKPENCLGCGMCVKMCPQGINVPELMPKAKEIFDGVPSWIRVCKEREAKASEARQAK